MLRTFNRKVTGIASAIVMSMIAGVTFGHDEILIGHSAAGQLKHHFHQHEPMRMRVSINPNLPGWNGSGPGIESEDVDDPKEDFFALPNNVQIEVVLVSIDPTLHLLSSNGSGFVTPGDTYVVLTPFFHWHCFWNLSAGDYGTVYEAQLQFFDKTGQFTPSEPVTIEFTPQCTGDVNLSATVDVNDLLAVINAWGACPNGACGGSCHPDLDESCVVDVGDLLTVINNWGVCVE